MFAPTAAVAGPVLMIWMSGYRIVVVTDELLLDGVVSVWPVGTAIVAVLVTLVGALVLTVALIVMVPLCPAASAPSVQLPGSEPLVEDGAGAGRYKGQPCRERVLNHRACRNGDRTVVPPSQSVLDGRPNRRRRRAGLGDLEVDPAEQALIEVWIVDRAPDVRVADAHIGSVKSPTRCVAVAVQRVVRAAIGGRGERAARRRKGGVVDASRQVEH